MLGSGGRPIERAQARPHPGPVHTVPPGYDGVAAYEATSGALNRESQAGYMQFDALHSQPVRQAARAAATLASLGDLPAAWREIGGARYGHFLHVYAQYLQFR